MGDHIRLMSYVVAMDNDARRERHREYMRERYKNDVEFRERHKALVKQTRQRQRQAARDLVARAKAAGCSTCSETEPTCLDFHHVCGIKEFALGDVMRGRYGAARIEAELAKCIVVCANCHRKIHAGLLRPGPANRLAASTKKAPGRGLLSSGGRI